MTSGPVLHIRNWSRFQHYHKPRPPWVKLYRDVLGDYTLMYQLEPAERWIVVGLWMLAAETDNAIPCDPCYLTHRLRVSVTADVLAKLQVLGVLDDGEWSRCALDKAYSQVEVETESEEEEETEKPLSSNDWPMKPKKEKGRYIFPSLFEDAWKEYPRRDAPDSKVGAYRAFRARVKAGSDPALLVTSATHYRESCEARGRDGTKFVKMASTFWGPDEHWLGFAERVGTNRNAENPNGVPLEGGGFYVGG